MKLTTKEIAYMTSVAEGSIRNIRLRKRKKLGLEELDLSIWVEQLDQTEPPMMVVRQGAETSTEMAAA